MRSVHTCASLDHVTEQEVRPLANDPSCPQQKLIPETVFDDADDDDTKIC